MPRPGRPMQLPASQYVANGPQPSSSSSAHSTPSPSQRTASLSPASDLPSPYPRQEYMYRTSAPGITSHPLSLLTGELQPLTPRPTPTTTPTIPSGMGPSLNRLPPTSNPSYHAPLSHTSLPPILEPSLKGDFQLQRAGSPTYASPSVPGPPPPPRTSPHLSSLGYHSPSYTSAADDQFYFPPPPPAPSFQTQSTTPEPGLQYSENSLQKKRPSEFHSSYEAHNRKVSSTA